jgi:predicted nucleic acid-binding protein
MNAVDTNVLIYARDPRDARKQRIAIDLLMSLMDGVLLWQVACEYLAASRKLAAFGHTDGVAFEDIQDLRLVWTLALPGWTTLERAMHLATTCSISTWDALVVAACLENDIETLHTEDLHPHLAFAPLKVINPFA